MLKKKLCISTVIALIIVAIGSINVNATTKTYSDEQIGYLAFNDYGWVVMKCYGSDTETYSIANCNIKRTGRSQFTKIEASRTDMPSFSPRMTNLAYYDANDNVKKKFDMTPQTYWRSSDWAYSAARENYTTVTYRRNVSLYSKFQVNVSAGGSIFAGWVYKFKFKINE